jgi:prolyl-tRNA editing enzyme YbaK/EbsC (Cys-tRNA(Pro) deacylase)
MLTPSDLENFMDQNDIAGEILSLEAPTPTVEAAAQAVGTQADQIVKSLLFSIGDQGVLAITCGTQRVERRKIAALYGVSSKKVKLASPEFVLEKTGYPVGTVPPFGHLQPIPTLVDPGVLEHSLVYAGGGKHNTLLRVNPQAFLTTGQVQVIDLHQSPEE